MPLEPLHIQGLQELTRAFTLADKELRRELRTRLAAVAEPVRLDAERLALSGIRNMTIPWSVMRVGVTAKLVYVAPKLRGVKTKGADPRRRRNLFDLLLDRALTPALEQNEQRIIASVEDMLEHVGATWERAA